MGAWSMGSPDHDAPTDDEREELAYQQQCALDDEEVTAEIPVETMRQVSEGRLR